MAREWYYCDPAGHWQGPFGPDEMKKLAVAGLIQPETRIRKGEDGPTASGKNVTGLFSTDIVPVGNQLPVPADNKTGGYFGAITSFASTAAQGITSAASTASQGISFAASTALSTATDTASQAATLTMSGVSTVAQTITAQLGNVVTAILPEPGKPIEEIIGDVMTKEGTRITGLPEANLCTNIPPRFLGGNVIVLMHTKGLRLQPPKGEPFLIRKEQMIEAQHRLEKTEKTVFDPGAAVAGAIVGCICFGPVGGVIGGLGGGSQIVKGKRYLVDLSFVDEKCCSSRLVLDVFEQDAKRFAGELQTFLGVKKKGFWR